jgi:hypothetical protein
VSRATTRSAEITEIGDEFAPPAAVTAKNVASPLSNRIVNVGFVTALVLAIACLVMSGAYAFKFQSNAESLVMQILRSDPAALADGHFQLFTFAQAYLSRVLLLSCGVFVGMAFGFLGFALFLLGVNGDIAAEGQAQGTSLKVSRLAPGAFVIACSAILVGVCATRPVVFDYNEQLLRPPSAPPVSGGKTGPAEQDREGALPPPTVQPFVNRKP